MQGTEGISFRHLCSTRTADFNCRRNKPNQLAGFVMKAEQVNSTIKASYSIDQHSMQPAPHLGRES